MENKKNRLYELRYEVASERKVVPGFTLIPSNDRSAESQHISDQENLKKIQRFAINGDSKSVKSMLTEFPTFKREDIKKMLIKIAVEKGKTLEI